MGTIYYETAPMPQTDGTNIVVNGDGKLDLGTDVTTKLSVQLLMSTSGNFATLTDATYIGEDYLLTVFCSNGNRYIKSQNIVGNTITVEFDDDVTSETVILECLKKGV